MKRFALVYIAVLFIASAALGQMRTIPHEAVPGIMSPGFGTTVVLDGKNVALGPAVIIRNEKNLIILPSALAPSSAVRYTRDAQGQIARVWVLTNAEKRQK